MVSQTVTEVKQTKPPVLSNDEKLEQGYRWVTVPLKDMYGYLFKGIALNQDYYPSGTHLLPSEVANEIEERLKKFQDYSIRLMRPDADVQSLKEIGAIAK